LARVCCPTSSREISVAINTKKVIMAGLAAGVVVNIVDYVSNGVIFADRMRAESNAFKPGLGDMMAQMSGSVIAQYVVMDFVIGFLLAWTYAAIRPRFGAGPKTAVYAAIVFWVFGAIVASGYKMMGSMSSGLWWSYMVVWGVALLLGSLAAGMVYSEDAATA
jgi:hypothetical protein